ncbi:WbqC family protein [Providencia stuartii]|uniref:WbqC family protein n=1 Tax=Providencia stuartii TaxID=588 RepID=UPI0024ABDF9F|nr:WbqC family protein [Providencia stuartii]MCX3071631.1 WbqC family protein [Providencia stuartii]
MILAVMQPYLFPYIGYYQLAYHSDMFIFYDDVNYIKGGYINRNNILTKNGKQLFTVPINHASSFKKINELEFSSNVKKTLATIQQAYSKAPNFNNVYPIIENILISNNRNVAKMASNSIIDIFKYLDIPFMYEYSSNIDYNHELDAKNKLYNFCKLYGANKYTNTPGGKALYNKDEFKDKGIELSFIETNNISYKQFNNDNFEKNLSIIDLLMNLKKENIIELLGDYNVN